MNSLRAGVPLLLLLCAAVLSTNAYAKGQKNPEDCMQTATTQIDLDRCAGMHYQKAADRLHSVYGQILKEYAKDPVFIKAFEASRKAWLAYRDAQMKMMFPHADEAMYYGTILPMCEAQYEEALTKARTAQVMQWIKGTPEGDACAGSVKTIPHTADAQPSAHETRPRHAAALCYTAENR